MKIGVSGASGHLGRAASRRQLQQDWQKEADVFVRAMYKKPQPEAYIQRVKQATLEVPTDTAVALIHNMISVTDFSNAVATINRPHALCV